MSPPATIQTPTPESAKPWYKSGRWWFRAGRWALVALLLAWGGWQLMYDKVADVCQGEVADNSAVVQVCQPISLTDPRIAWTLLVILLLLLPDLSEIELAGVLSLKRAVAEVKQDNNILRGEVQQLRITTSQIAHQQQQIQLNVYNQQVPDAVHQFQKDVATGDTGPLSPAEEAGGYAYLAFISAFAGLVPELFDGWSAYQPTLIGWVLETDGTFDPRHFADNVPANIAETIKDSLDPNAGADGPLMTPVDEYLSVTAYVRAEPALGLGNQLLGALTVVLENPANALPKPDDQELLSQLVSLAANVEAAAGAYAVLLVRVLGEPSTIADTDPQEAP